MTVEQFRKFKKARPFEPFTIRTADGLVYDVSHPEVISSSPAGRTVIIMHADGSMVTIDLLLVTSIQTKPPTVTSASSEELS